MRTLIIAEAGINHNGNINLAKKLIDIAAHAGADLVKFQTFDAARLTTHSAQKANYQIQSTKSAESQQEMLKKLELTESMHNELISYCNSQNIKFFSTGFDIESVNLLVELGQELFKIPSGEINNLPYLRNIGQLGKPIIISTGMSNLDEVETAIETLEASGALRTNITVLHCTTAYPAPIPDVNLRAMQTMGIHLKTSVGYSDHTLGIEVPIAAVALGATIIEKHFTLDRALPGPDHKASLEPIELKNMVTAIRNVELALGDGIKRVMSSEMENRLIARKSIVTSRGVKKGEVFTSENLTTKRPGVGVSPMSWDKMLGLKAGRSYQIDELIDES